MGISRDFLADNFWRKWFVIPRDFRISKMQGRPRNIGKVRNSNVVVDPSGYYVSLWYIPTIPPWGSTTIVRVRVHTSCSCVKGNWVIEIMFKKDKKQVTGKRRFQNNMWSRLIHLIFHLISIYLAEATHQTRRTGSHPKNK